MITNFVKKWIQPAVLVATLRPWSLKIRFYGWSTDDRSARFAEGPLQPFGSSSAF
jgi:hypothetical protein